MAGAGLYAGPCEESVKGEFKACAVAVCGKVNEHGDFGANASLAELAGVEAQAKTTLKTRKNVPFE